MGSGYSKQDYDRFGLEFYETALQHTCLLPDISIDEALLKYSGSDSNFVLQSDADGLISTVPGFIDRLGGVLAPMTPIPNAVGLGALVISMIMELVIKSPSPTTDNSYSMLRRVFGEEKGSAVRDTVSEYLRRHRIFMGNDQQLRQELQRLEQQLSNHLTILRNSLLYDGQMSTRGLKIWVNGASFHVQMLIHQARLNVQTGKRASDYVSAITASITLYLLDLDDLLEKFKTHKGGINMSLWTTCGRECSSTCFIQSEKCGRELERHGRNPCRGDEVKEAFMKHFVSRNGQIPNLKNHFANIRNNLNFLIFQSGSFTLPSGA